MGTEDYEVLWRPTLGKADVELVVLQLELGIDLAREIEKAIYCRDGPLRASLFPPIAR